MSDVYKSSAARTLVHTLAVSICVTLPFAQLYALRHRKQTVVIRLFRAALIPVCIASATGVQHAMEPVATFGIGFVGVLLCFVVLKSLEYGVVQTGRDYRWIGIDKSVRINERNGISGDLACFTTMRGIGWSFGPPEHQLPALRTSEHWLPYSSLRFISIVTQKIVANEVLGIAAANHKTFTPLFELLSLPNPPKPAHFILLGLIQFWYASLIIEFLSSLSSLCHCVGNALLRAIMPVSLRPGPFNVRMHPPALNAPWAATSVRSFWSKHWHCMLRRPLLVLAQQPATRLLGRNPVGALVGAMAAFVLSGFVHDFYLFVMECKRPSNRGWSTFPCTGWFIAQGLACVAEATFTRISGRRVGGRVGASPLPASLKE